MLLKLARSSVLTVALLSQIDYAGAAQQNCIARDAQGDFMGWADHPHCLVDAYAQSTVLWFDDWFGDGEIDDKANVALRAIGESYVDETGDIKLGLRLRAKIALPKASKRLSLIIEDESQDGNPSQTLLDRNEFAVGLRWVVASLERFRVETDAGVRSAFDPYVRARTAFSLPLTPDDQLRLSLSARFSADEKLRAIQNTNYAHVFPNDMVGQVFHVLDHRQEDRQRGEYWVRGGLLSRSLPESSAVSVGISQEGVTQGWQEDARYVWWRYRRPAYRDWLFFEIEPRLTQTRQTNWDTLASIAFRLEVHFGQQAQGRDIAQQPAEQEIYVAEQVHRREQADALVRRF